MFFIFKISGINFEIKLKVGWFFDNVCYIFWFNKVKSFVKVFEVDFVRFYI